MMHEWANGSKPVSDEWHRTRQEAREKTFSLKEWDDIEIERYDLEENGVSIITGKDNNETYRVETENGEVVDIRDAPEVGP